MIGKRSDALGTPTAHNALAITTHNNLMAWSSHIIVEEFYNTQYSLTMHWSTKHNTKEK
jgi:hypothetical protein